MKLLGWALFAAVVAVATVRVILSRDRTCYEWTHDEIDAAHASTALTLAQWRTEGSV